MPNLRSVSIAGPYGPAHRLVRLFLSVGSWPRTREKRERERERDNRNIFSNVQSNFDIPKLMGLGFIFTSSNYLTYK